MVCSLGNEGREVGQEKGILTGFACPGILMTAYDMYSIGYDHTLLPWGGDFVTMFLEMSTFLPPLSTFTPHML